MSFFLPCWRFKILPEQSFVKYQRRDFKFQPTWNKSLGGSTRQIAAKVSINECSIARLFIQAFFLGSLILFRLKGFNKLPLTSNCQKYENRHKNKQTHEPRRSSSVGRASFKRSCVGGTLLNDVGSNPSLGTRWLGENVRQK